MQWLSLPKANVLSLAPLCLAIACNPDATVPSDVAVAITPTNLSAGVDHTCMLVPGGLPYCWGAGLFGQLGDGTRTTRFTPTVVVVPAGETFASVDAGNEYSCALTATGTAYCWGNNSLGRLGDGTTTMRPTPTAVTLPTGTTFISVSGGFEHTCGLTPTGAAYCWGFNLDGQLGDGTTTTRLTPTAVTMPAEVTFTSVDAGNEICCALAPTGAAYCWGANSFGRLGDGTLVDRLTPTAVLLPTGVTFARVTVGLDHTCGLTQAGAAYCWGYNEEGQIGDGTTTSRLTPVAVAIPAGTILASVSPGGTHTCGLTPAGAAYCWGKNSRGQVGDGTTTDRLTPVAVTMPTGVTLTSLALGNTHSCGLTAARVAYCWGANAWGQLGDGTNTDRLTPVKVMLP